MQITLNIDPTQLSSEVSDFIKSLTEADKNQIVKNIVTQYYSDYKDFEKSERQLKDKEALHYARSNMNSWDKPNEQTDEEVRKNYRYDEYLKKQETLAEKTRREISGRIQVELINQMNQFVKEDQEYQNFIKECMATVKDQFPSLVQGAMVQHLASQLPNFMEKIYANNNNLNNQLDDLNRRLLSLGR